MITLVTHVCVIARNFYQEQFSLMGIQQSCLSKKAVHESSPRHVASISHADPSNVSLSLPEIFEVSQESSEMGSDDDINFSLTANLEPPHELLGHCYDQTSASMTPSQRPHFPLEFFINISRIRCSELSELGSYSIWFSWARDIRRSTASSTLTDTPEWSEDFRFLWTSPASFLEGVLKIKLLYTAGESPSNRKVIATCSIPLEGIATGPIHHDMALHRRNHPFITGRVQLDITMEQVCSLFVAPVAVLVEQNTNSISERFEMPEEDLPVDAQLPLHQEDARKYEWLINLIFTAKDGRETEFASCWSEQCTNPLWEGVDPAELEAEENTELPKSVGPSVVRSVKSMLGSFEDPEKAMGAVSVETLNALDRIQSRGGSISQSLRPAVLPQFQMRTTEDSLDTHHLRIVVHRRHRVSMSNIVDTKDDVFGEAWVAYNRLIKFSLPSSKRTTGLQVSVLKDNIYSQGQVVGKLFGLFVVQNQPTYHQVGAGVRTENGIQRVAPIVLPSSRVTSTPKEIDSIATIHRKLLDILYSDGQYSPLVGSPKVSLAYSPNSRAMNNDSQVDRQRLLLNLQENLKACRNDTFTNIKVATDHKGFLYSSQESLITSQRVLVDINSHIVESLDLCSYEDSGDYYTCILLLFKRQELDFPMLVPDCFPHYQGAAQPGNILRDAVFKLRTNFAKAGEGKAATETTILSEDLNFIRLAAAEIFRKSPLLWQSVFGTLDDASCFDRSDEHPHTPSWISRVVKRKSKMTINAGLNDAEKLAILKLHQRMRLCRDLWLSMHNLLFNLLWKLNSGIEPSPEERRYQSLLLCHLYFRLPAFRAEFLAAVLPPSDQVAQVSSDEWRGNLFALDGTALDSNRSWYSGEPAKLLLDWQAWHNCVDEYWGRDNLQECLRALPHHDDFHSPKWRAFLGLRGGLFQLFVLSWIRQVRARLRGKSVTWQKVPGFIWLLKCLILDLQRKGPSVAEGSVAACGALIAANGRLLPTFMKVLWLRTNVYRTEDVYHSFNILDYWFTVSIEYHQVLPDNFDHKFLTLGIQRVIECDLVISKAQALWFLYRHLHTFQPSHRDSLIKTILLKHAQSLILHWNSLARRMIAYVLIFQVLPIADDTMLKTISTLLVTSVGVELTTETLRVTRDSTQAVESTAIVDERLARYQGFAVEAIKEALTAFTSWKASGGKSRPAVHVPLFLGLERDAEPSTMH